MLFLFKTIQKKGGVPTDTVIGANIKRSRRNHGLTQVQLTEKAKISRSYLANIESGKYKPSVDSLCAIAHALDVSPLWLLLSSSDKLVFDNLFESYGKLNEEGQEKVFGYLDDLIQSGKYIRHFSSYEVVYKPEDEEESDVQREVREKNE